MKRLGKTLVTTGFLILITLYFYFIYDASLFHHYHQPMFLFSREFLKSFLLYPGGLLDWAGQLIFQLFAWNWLGSLILTCLAGTGFLAVYQILKRTGFGPFSLSLSFIPVGFLLFYLNHYNSPLVISLRFLSAILLVSIYFRSGRFKPVFIFLLWPVYLFLGGWNFIFYCILAVLLELLQPINKIRFLYIGIHLLAAALVPFIAARFVYLITLQEAYDYLNPVEFYYEPFRFAPGLAVKALYLSLPVIFLGKLAVIKFIGNKVKAISFPYNFSKLFLLYYTLLLALAMGVLFFSHDSELKTKIAIDRFAYQRRWGQVLKYAPRLTAYDRQVNVLVNRALYFKGRLLNDMFWYPQLLGTDGLFPYRITASQIAISASDLLFDLAHISASQTMAFEGQTKFPYNPRIMKRLFMTNLINRQDQIAKKFTDILKMSLIYRRWAENKEQLLFDETRSNADSVVSQMRALKPSKDFFLSRENPNIDLVILLDQHPENRMAFEFLIAYYLMETRIMNIYARMNQFSRYGYQRLPRHVEEALILLKSIHPEVMGINQISFRPETLNRFKAFNEILLQTKINPEKAMNQLQRDFRDTYWYYVRYVDPRQTHIKLTQRKIDEN
jgi:hypothetical protein